MSSKVQFERVPAQQWQWHVSNGLPEAYVAYYGCPHRDARRKSGQR
jgi:hypothetical protein